jgi:uncharacterized protein YkwD
MEPKQTGKLILKALFLISIVLIVLVSGCATSNPVAPTPPTTLPPAQTIPPTTPVSIPVSTPPVATSPVSTTGLPPTPTLVTPPAPVTPPPPASIPTPTPAAVYTPSATAFKPTGTLADLFQYALDLINQDRKSGGLNPVVLNYNAAAQEHAKDMVANHFIAHWGTDGLKPYMRYTTYGGLNYEDENSAYYASSASLSDIKTRLQSLEKTMMTDDAGSNWAHRDNILNKWHKKVNIGIAYDSNSMALVQQFEGDYLEFFQPPSLKGTIISLSGRINQPDIKLNNIAINFDPAPQPLTGPQLNDPNSPYHRYGLTEIIGQIFPPPPPGASYNNLQPNSVIATQGSFGSTGQFSIEANIASLLTHGPGIYTVCLVGVVGGEARPWTNYSIFVK